MRLSQKEEKLEASMKQTLEKQRQTLARLSSKMEALNPLAVLSRGYAAVSGENGEAITKVSQITVGDTLNIRFADGNVSAKVTKGNEHGKENVDL